MDTPKDTPTPQTPPIPPHSNEPLVLVAQNDQMYWMPHNPPKPPGVWRSLSRSKKSVTALLATVISIAAAIAKAFEVNIDTETLMTTLSPILAYIVGQGIADHGKEKAKIDKNIA